MDRSSLIGKRVAFFGGSFDPPHWGHLAVAQAAQQALGLDTVLFAPVGAQPLKPHGSIASFDDRLAMTRLAVEGNPGFVTSLADAPKSSGEPNYTLDTLLQLRGEISPDGALFCLMGADSFAALKHWHGAAQIPFVASLIVASRPGESLDQLATALPSGWRMESTPSPERSCSDVELRRYLLHNSMGASTPFFLLPGLHIEISASDIRKLVRSARGDCNSVGELLPNTVFDYIRSHGFYR
jgi:nicotinate-nucleotide adenylyltransferase